MTLQAFVSTNTKWRGAFRIGSRPRCTANYSKKIDRIHPQHHSMRVRSDASEQSMKMTLCLLAKQRVPFGIVWGKSSGEALLNAQKIFTPCLQSCISWRDCGKCLESNKVFFVL